MSGCFLIWIVYIKGVKVIFSKMPKPEIVMSSAFGMGFWIDEEGVFMSCPAFEFGAFDVDNAVPVEDWDDFSVYSQDHMRILAQLVRMWTLQRDYVNIGYYAEKFGRAAV